MKRREFLAGCAALGVAACTGKAAEAPLPPGELAGSAYPRGHRLRQEPGAEPFSSPSEVRRVPLLIVGGGIAGLSAGWKLQRAGFDALAVELS